MRNVRNCLSLLLALALVFVLLPQAALAADPTGQCGNNLTWTFRESTGELTISGSGKMTDWTADSDVPWFSIRELIQKVSIPDSVTSIGGFAFYSCSGLTSITIPNSVASIGNFVFRHCSGLTSITIPNSVTSIGNYAFCECFDLSSITIPNSVTSIGRGAFYRCTGLMSITIPNSVTSISNDAFYRCSWLTSITIPNSVTSIGDNAFYNCSGLTSITIPNSVTSIGDYAFYSCSGLTSITIPNSVTSIGKWAFCDCSNLPSIVIPESVTSIGKYAFNCSSLTNVTILNKDCTIVESPATLGDSTVTTIYGYEGSTAETYANNYGYKFVSPPGPCAAGHDFKDGVCTRCGAKDPNYVDRTRLNAAIEKAKALKEVDYTPETFSKVKTALKSAETLPADANQGAVDAAADALIAAMDALEEADPFRFEDVKDETAFYFIPVYWAYNAKPQITNGLDLIYFGPNSGCTRGQVVTFLWRAAGCPKPESTETAFTDLKPGAFYTKAVAWAVEKGITNGTTPTTFAPDATCTRGQIVTFLWRFRGMSEPTIADTGFTDVNGTAFYAKAVAWAVENGVTKGMTPTTFVPNNTCTRGQIVTFLYRTMNG